MKPCFLVYLIQGCGENSAVQELCLRPHYPTNGQKDMVDGGLNILILSSNLRFKQVYTLHLPLYYYNHCHYHYLVVWMVVLAFSILVMDALLL